MGPRARSRRLASHADLIEGYLAEQTFSDDPRLADLVGAMRRSLLRKVQRPHSILCLEVARVFGLDPADALPSAAGAVGGLALEADYAGRPVDRETLEVMHDHKTGTPFEASGLIGAILAGATTQDREAVAGYARPLGLCLRIGADDRRHATPIAAPGASLEAERATATFQAVYGHLGARLLADEALEGAIGALDEIDRDTEGLAELALCVRRGEYATGARAGRPRAPERKGM